MLSIPSNYFADKFPNLVAIHPRIGELFKDALKKVKTDLGSIPGFRQPKLRLSIILGLLSRIEDLSEVDRREVLDHIIEGGDIRELRRAFGEPMDPNTVVAWTSGLLYGRSLQVDQNILDRSRQVVNNVSDPDFLARLPELVRRVPTLTNNVADLAKNAHAHFDAVITKVHKQLSIRASAIQEEDCKKQIERGATKKEEEELKVSRLQLIHEIEEVSKAKAKPEM